MIPVNGSSSLSVASTNANIDGSRRAASDTQGAGQPVDSTQASGVQTTNDQTVNESAASSTTQSAAQLQVVTETESLEAADSRSNIIDEFA